MRFKTNFRRTKQTEQASSPTVLMFHASYRQPGGEDNSFVAEANCFAELGYDVIKTTCNNSELRGGLHSALSAPLNLIVLVTAVRTIRKHRPEIIYINNTWPGLSTAPAWAARLLNIPTLQAIRNYRLICPSAKLDGASCCTVCGSNNHPWSCIVNGCYNGSRGASFIVAFTSRIALLAAWRRQNHLFVATSQQTKNLHVAAGIRESQIVVRPNFLKASHPFSARPGKGVTFVGRLTPEKGIDALIRSWPSSADHLTVVGDGPLKESLESLVRERHNVSLVGRLDGDAVVVQMRKSALTVIPSLWAEPFGRTAIESMSVGTPVMCTGGGALAEIIGETGYIIETVNRSSIEDILEIYERTSDKSALRESVFSRFNEYYSESIALNDLRKLIERVVNC